MALPHPSNDDGNDYCTIFNDSDDNDNDKELATSDNYQWAPCNSASQAARLNDGNIVTSAHS